MSTLYGTAVLIGTAKGCRAFVDEYLSTSFNCPEPRTGSIFVECDHRWRRLQTGRLCDRTKPKPTLTFNPPRTERSLVARPAPQPILLACRSARMPKIRKQSSLHRANAVASLFEEP